MRDAARAAPHRLLRLACFVLICLLLVGTVELAGVLWGTAAVTALCRVAIAMLLAMSYYLLLGLAGMLSFSQASYAGLGGFATVWVLNTAAAPLATSAIGATLLVLLVPLAGAAGGALAGATLGWLATRRAGGTFAMITLGIGEMVAAFAAMAPAWFGGAAGVMTDRTLGGVAPFASMPRVAWLVVGWGLLGIAAMRAFTHSPLASAARAVRDNAVRAAFLGYDPRAVRYRVSIVSAAFAGLAGALGVLLFEIATPDSLSTLRSGDIVMMTVLGGTTHWIGPLLGALVASLAADVLPGYTRAWAFYLALAFVGVVLALARRTGSATASLPEGVPGIAGIIGEHASTLLALRRLPPALRCATAWRLGRSYCAVLAALGIVLVGGTTLVEHVYRARLVDEPLAPRPWPDSRAAVIIAVIALAAGALWQRRARARLRRERAACLHATGEPSHGGANAWRGCRERINDAADADPGPGTGPIRPQAPAPVLTVDKLRMNFGRTQILRGVDLQVRAGEKLALIGPNGAGKTTLFDLLSHRLLPSSGYVQIGAQRLCRETPQALARLGVARTFQISGLFHGMTVFEHLRCAVSGNLPMRYAWHRSVGSYRCINARAWRALDAVGLPPHLLASELAYADQRALELAMAVAQEARLLLLDEPTAGMNQAEAARLLALIERISEGRTVVMIEHDMDVVFAFADRVAVLVDGVIIACDVPARVRDDAGVRDAYLGALTAEDVDG